MRTIAAEEKTAEAGPLDLVAELEQLSDEEVDFILEKGAQQ
jgi:hypothetical protein